MTITYNEKTLEVSNESVYFDFIIPVNNIERGVEIINDFADVTDYVFNLVEYTNMEIKRRMLVIDDTGINVKVSYKRRKE